MNSIEMDGFLRGKCIPGDMLVNESNAEYLVRKFQEMSAQRDALAAENACLMNVDNWMSRSDTGYAAQAIAEGNGADADESLRAGMRAIIDDIPTPATDAFLAEVRASGVEIVAYRLKQFIDDGDFVGDEVPLIAGCIDVASDMAAQIRQGAAL